MILNDFTKDASSCGYLQNTNNRRESGLGECVCVCVGEEIDRKNCVRALIFTFIYTCGQNDVTTRQSSFVIRVYFTSSR